MNKSEVMIGDRFSNGGNVVTVVGLSEYSALCLENGVETWVSYNGLSPIRLSAEIMFKSGWDVGLLDGRYNCYREGMNVRFRIDGEVSYAVLGDEFLCDVPYVHSLQHLLTALGRGDISDGVVA